jgi:hypothetical protein
VVGTGTENFNYGSGVLSQAAETSFIVIPSANGYSANKSGTVSVNTSSANVVGSSTAFLSQYQVGDYFFCNTSTKRVVSVTSDTSMAVDSVFGFASSGLTHQKTWPAGVPINFASASRTINITSTTTASVSLGEASNADFTASVYFDTLRYGTKPIKKEIKKSTFIKIQANTNAAGVTGPWCLGIPDVVRLNAVYIDETGGTYANTNPNIAGAFILNPGQYDSYYGLAYISSKKPIAPNSTLLISVDNFVANPSEGVGFFTAASYPVDDVDIANTSAIQIYQIPQYTSSIGKTVDLRDCIDFRPYAVNNAVANATIATATINPSNTLTLQTYGAGGTYLASPDSNYQSVVQYYLSRKDRISLTIAGQILVTEGDPSLAPTAPNEIPGTMTIGFANVPPYPSLIPNDAKYYNRYDYSVQTSILQTKRYTMADINKLSKRIEKLEYYTSLSLLEQATNSLTVRSDATGQNRFKNGILVDPFRDHSIGNTNDGTYNISIDRNSAEARPTFNQKTTELWFDAAASTAVLAGDMVLLPHTSNNLNQSQQFASKYRSCIEGNVYNYRGVLELNPVGITNPDLQQRPTINGSIDNYTNFVGGGRSSRFGTEWGNWTDVGSAKTVNKDSQISLTASSQSSQNFRNTTTTTLAQEQKRVGTTFTVQSTQSSVSTGDYVTDVSIQTFVPSRDVFFRARGMKPNTKLYVFFDNVNVNNYCLNMNPYSGSFTKSGGRFKTDAGSNIYVAYDGTVYAHNNNWGGQIISDAFGNVYGVFKIPVNVFKSGELEFKLTDISNLSQGQDAVTTQASYKMFCSALSVQTERTNLTITSPSLVAQEVTDTQTIYQNTTSSNEWSIALPPPPKPPDPPPPVINIITINNNTTVVNNNITVVEVVNEVTEVTEVTIQITEVTNQITEVTNQITEINNNTTVVNNNITVVEVVNQVINVTEIRNNFTQEIINNIFPETDRTVTQTPVITLPTVDVFISPQPPVIDAPVITPTVCEPAAPARIEYYETGDGTSWAYEYYPPPAVRIETYETGDGSSYSYEYIAPVDDGGYYYDINANAGGGSTGE